MQTFRPTEPVDILLIEDNPGDIRLTEEAFKSALNEVRFQIATDGEEAVRILHECQQDDERPFPDLILLDLNLPRLDGFSILEMLKDDFDHPSPPVLVLSSSTAREDIIKSYERAANAYLTKPDSPDEFDSMVRAVEDFWIESVQHPPIKS